MNMRSIYHSNVRDGTTTCTRSDHSSQGKENWLITIVLFLITFPAEAVAKPIVKHSGHLTLEADAGTDEKFEIDMKGELKVKTKRVQKTRVVAAAEAGYQTLSFTLEDLYLDYKPGKKLLLTLGLSKKIMGLEYEDGRRQRITIKRSALYEKMESHGLVGHQINFRINKRFRKRHNGVRLSAAIGGDNSRNSNLILSLRHVRENWGYGFWLLGESHYIDDHFMPVVAEIVSLWHRSDRGRIVIEGFHGIDAHQTEYERLFADNRKVQFAGIKIECAANAQLGKNIVFSPLTQFSWWVDDIRYPENTTLQARAGLQLGWNRFRLSFNAETQSQKNTEENRIVYSQKDRYYGELAYFF